MSAFAKLALALLPGGGVALAAMAVLRCRHRHEVLCIRAEEPVMGLKCVTCLRTRPHPWAGEPARHHRTQEARPEPMTGIEREAQRETDERCEVAKTLAMIEWQAKKEAIAAKTRRRHGQ